MGHLRKQDLARRIAPGDTRACRDTIHAAKKVLRTIGESDLASSVAPQNEDRRFLR
jgi:hypothetical protein